MNRRIWTGVIAGVLAATLLLAVGIGSYEAGRNDEVVTRVVSDGDVVRVVGDHWGRGPGFGFLLFPLFIILLIALVARGRGGGGGWHRRYGPWGYGPPGPYGPDPEDRFDEWHRRSHERGVSGAPAPSGQAPSDDVPQDAMPSGRPPTAPGDG